LRREAAAGRGIAAVGAGAHGRGEVLAEARRRGADLVERVRDPALHVAAGALAGGADLALAAAEAERTLDLRGPRLDLLGRARDPPAVTPALGLVALGDQLVELRAIAAARRL